MTVIHSIPSTLLVALDISKHRHEVLIGVPGKKRRRRLTVLNTLEDFERLAAALARQVIGALTEALAVANPSCKKTALPTRPAPAISAPNAATNSRAAMRGFFDGINTDHFQTETLPKLGRLATRMVSLQCQ